MKLNFIILFLFLSQISYCQADNSVAVKDTVTLDPHYFILGTLSDYMGRFQYVDREKQIDRYYPYEKPLADYLTGYIKNQLNIEVQTVFEPSLHSEMFSEELSKNHKHIGNYCKIHQTERVDHAVTRLTVFRVL